MPNGFEALGELLTGGSSANRQNAFYEGQGQRAKIEHLSAQTQGAMAQAKLHQMEAKKTQLEEEARSRYAESALATGLAKTPEEASGYADFMVGGAANFQQATQGRGNLQEQGFRETLADTLIPPDRRLAASSAIQGKVQTAGEGGPEPTTAVRNYEYLNNLPPEKRDGFGRVLRADQIINAGGVPTAQPTAGGPAREVVPVNTVTSNLSATTGAKTGGKGMAERTLDLPRAKAMFASNTQKQDAISNVVQTLRNDPALWKAVGLGKMLSQIPGTEGTRIRGDIHSLRAQLAVQAVNDARQMSKTGGAFGNTNLREWEDLSKSFGNMDENMSAKDFANQMAIMGDRITASKQITSNAFYETYPELREQSSGKTDFNTEAEAEAAGLAPGTRITIGGRAATWQ